MIVHEKWYIKWAKSGVIVFAIVIMLVIGEVFLATALPNCLLSEEFDNESVCAGAGISLVKWFLGSAVAMIFISVSWKWVKLIFMAYIHSVHDQIWSQLYSIISVVSMPR